MGVGAQAGSERGGRPAVSMALKVTALKVRRCSFMVVCALSAAVGPQLLWEVSAHLVCQPLPAPCISGNQPEPHTRAGGLHLPVMISSGSRQFESPGRAVCCACAQIPLKARQQQEDVAQEQQAPKHGRRIELVQQLLCVLLVHSWAGHHAASPMTEGGVWGSKVTMYSLSSTGSLSAGSLNLPRAIGEPMLAPAAVGKRVVVSTGLEKQAAAAAWQVSGAHSAALQRSKRLREWHNPATPTRRQLESPQAVLALAGPLPAAWAPVQAVQQRGVAAATTLLMQQGGPLWGQLQKLNRYEFTQVVVVEGRV